MDLFEDDAIVSCIGLKGLPRIKPTGRVSFVAIVFVDGEPFPQAWLCVPERLSLR